MRPGLIAQILEAHRAPGRRGVAPPVRDGWDLAVDQFAFGQSAGVLVLTAFATLGRPRLAGELTLACVGRGGTHPGFERSDEARRLVVAARRFGAHVARAGAGWCDPVHRDHFGAPGRLLVSAGEGCATCGALGMLALRATEIEVAAALGGMPLHVALRPRVVHISGGLSSWVSGHDVALEIERRMPGLDAPGTLLEIAGSGVKSLAMADRIALAARLGGRAAAVVFPSDEITHRYLRAHGRDADWKPLEGDRAEDGGADLDLELDLLEPSIAAADDPGASRSVRHAMGIEVRRVVLGPQLTYPDLVRAARMVQERHIAAGVELLVLPGSRTLIETARAHGVLEILSAAGARVIEGEALPGAAPAAALRLAGLCCGAAAERFTDGRTHWLVTSAETCVASALAGRLSDPRELDVPFHRDEEPEQYATAEAWIQRPAPPAETNGAGAAEGTAALPPGRPLGGALRGAVLLALGERVAAEEVLPWGARLSTAAAEIGALAGRAFAHRDPDFSARARHHGGGFILAGRELGVGPQRDQAALVLVELGVRAVLARSFDPAFLQRLVRAGVLPLRLRIERDARALRAGDELEIPGLPESLEAGKPLLVRNLTRGTQHTLPHDLRAYEIALVRAGGLLAQAREA